MRAILISLVFVLAICSGSTSTISAQDTDETLPTTSRASETVIVRDDFEDPATAVLGVESPDPGVAIYYEGGFYVIEANSSTYADSVHVPATDLLTDSTTAVNAAFLADGYDLTGRFLVINCREGADSAGYQLEVRPDVGTLTIWRLDFVESVALESFSFSDPAFLLSESHRIELSCNRDTMVGRVDGLDVVLAFDQTWTEGNSSIGAGTYTDSPGTFLAYFDDLAVSIPGIADTINADLPQPVNVLGDFDTVLQTVAQQTPSFGPTSLTLTQQTDVLDAQLNNLALMDFYATFTFTTPETAGQPWDVGLVFRSIDPDQWRLIIRSDSTWHLGRSTETPQASGLVADLRLEPLASNTVEMVVHGSIVRVVLNGQFVANLTLPPGPGAGDIWPATGFFADFIVPGQQITFTDLTIYELQPVGGITGGVGTENGAVPGLDEANATFLAARNAASQIAPVALVPDSVLTEQTGSLAFTRAGVDLTDSYTQAFLATPQGGSDADQPWDIAIGFRDQGGDEQYRFIVLSTNTWTFSYGGESLQTGNTLNLSVAPGTFNMLEVAVVDEVAYLGLNGVLITAQPLLTPAPSGDIWVAAGISAIAQNGRTTNVSGFQVWSLPS